MLRIYSVLVSPRAVWKVLALTKLQAWPSGYYHPDVAYVHNDKGDSSHFFAVNIQTGKVLATFELANARNYDWEDMSYGPCVDDCASSKCSADIAPLRYCIYIADIGDHGHDGPVDIIYMVREPDDIADDRLPVVSTLQFSWTEFDAETLMMSPDGRLFVISKVDGGQGMIADLPSSAWDNGRVHLNMTQTAKLQLSTGKNDPQGGEISPDGTEMHLIGEEGVYYLSAPNGDYIGAVKSSVPQKVQSDIRVPKTEGLAWRPDGSGFYVIAEGLHPTIYFYPKITDATIIG